jgi:polyisoprenoid-binding protein YceI
MARYALDKTSSRFTVRAFASGMLSSFGHNPTIAIRNFSGDAEFDPAAPERATMRVEIRADSLEVTDDIKSKDRSEIEDTMNRKVLETEKYPAITFETTTMSASAPDGARFQVNMNGILDLHGVTGTVPVAAQVMLMGDSMRASGEFSLRQSDYAIAPVVVAGGALKLKDELKFSFDIVARKQE